jgi:anti-sigma factor RsiW
MNHQIYQERISLYVDNALSDKESAKLFAHLSRCDDCRMFMKLTSRVHSHIAEEKLAEVPLSLDRRVFASVAAASDLSDQRPWYAPMWFTRISIPLPAAASILFLIIVGSLLFSPILAQEPQHQTEIPVPLASKIPSSLQRQLDLNK